jgi:4-amino-4-deoxy-L-arabinose transferase-like glycosyltransferase
MSADILTPSAAVRENPAGPGFLSRRHPELLVVLFALLVFLPSLLSPPHLMDDEDAARAQISRTMIRSGDWVTPRLDGIRYFEKPPLMYWMVAASIGILGDSETAARLPTLLCSIFLCWLVARMARRAIGDRAGLYAGLSLATCCGLWLFTRILIPDVALTLAVTLALRGFFRAVGETEDGQKDNSRAWALSAWVSLAAGLLLKGLIAVVFTVGPMVLYLLLTGLWRSRRTWRSLLPGTGIAITLILAAPWYILATLRNPPALDFAMHSTPGIYRGFFWYQFFNEQILRFLGRRYPHDFSNVPLPSFWLLHLVWLFPWSVFLVRAIRLQYRGGNPASRMHLLALCWIGVVMAFLVFVPTQEYYSMPAYPAIAILIGSAMAHSGERAWRWSVRAVGACAACASVAIACALWISRNTPAPGDIAQTLGRHPDAYTLSLGHLGDLTAASFAYLRVPLAIAGAAALVGVIGAFATRGLRSALALALMMVLFFQAARTALVAFDPYLGSYPLARALNHEPPGGLIVDNPYYEFASVFYYANRAGLILDGRANNLEYGSYAPDAPHVFIGDADFIARWRSPNRWYVASEDDKVDHLRRLVGTEALHPIVTAGGKTVYTNR